MNPEPPLPPASLAETAPESLLGRRRYFLNILWSWAGVGVLMATGLLVAPFLIRRLGTAQYGIWALALSLVEYFWLIDFGFRPATVKYSAEYRALNRTRELNQLLSTALGCACLGACAVLLVVWPNAERAGAYLKISSPEFPALVRIVGVSWAFGLVFNVFGAALEGFQRFDLSNRIAIASTLARSLATVAVVWQGYGLWEMGLVLLVTQGATYVALYVVCARIYPEMQLSPRQWSWDMTRRLLRYGRQVISAIAAMRILQAGMPSLIAYFLPVQHVTYYTVSQKSLDYAAEGVGRIGLVTSPRASAWMAQGEKDRVIRLAEYGNRYCLSLWALLATFLMVFSEKICRLWVNAEFAQHAGLLLPIIAAGYALWLGQFISAAILMGIGRYEAYSISLLAESLLVLGGLLVVLPRYGLIAAAILFSALVALNRCLNLGRIFCKEFRLPLGPFLRRIYLRPLAVSAASIVVLRVCEKFLAPGNSWAQLMALGAIHCLGYGTASVFLVLWPEHRALLWEKIVEPRWQTCRNLFR